jgi:hypothetical protein
MKRPIVLARCALAALSLALASCGGPESGDDRLAEASSPARVSAPIQVTSPQPAPSAGFGQTVAVDRSALAVTEFLGRSQVHVRTYALVDGAAVETGDPLFPDDPLSDVCFGETLDLDGDTLAVGVPCAEGGAGTVLIFSRDRTLGVWTRTATLRPGGAEAAGFGKSLALRTNRLAVGAPYAALGAGAVHVYVRSPHGLAPDAVLTAADAAPGDHLGRALALAGEVLVATAPDRPAPDALSATGRLHVFERTASGWIASATLSPAATGPGEGSGEAVAAAGGVVAVAGDKWVSHSVHLFELGAGGWVESDVEAEQRGLPDCGYAHALAMDGGLLAIGMPTLAGPAGEYRAGAVRLFRRGTAGWARVGEISTGLAGDKAGHAVDLSGGLLAVGVPGTSPYGSLSTDGPGRVIVVRP